MAAPKNLREQMKQGQSRRYLHLSIIFQKFFEVSELSFKKVLTENPVKKLTFSNEKSHYKTN